MTPEVLATMKEGILADRPVLRSILERYGDYTLRKYALVLSQNPGTVEVLLKKELIDAVALQTGALLGDDVAQKAAAHLEKTYYVSTTDHLGPLTHPFFVHADLMAAAAQEAEVFIVLACSNISLGNSSYPRSLLFHGDTAIGSDLQKLHFFPASERMSPVFGHRPYHKHDIAKMCGSLESMVSRGVLTEKASAQLGTLLASIYESESALEQKNYAAQITVTNFHLWRQFFDQNTSSLPDLLYLEQEKLVLALLSDHHLDSNTPLYRLLFDDHIRTQAVTAFDSIPGAFSSEKGRGTFLFWYLPEGAVRRIALRNEGAELVSLDGIHRIALEPSTMRAHLQSGVLIPSTLLCLLTLNCYYGLKCLGGFSQVNYLTSMHKAYAKLFPSTTHDEAVGSSEAFCGDLIIALLQKDAQIVPATGLDLALYHTYNSWASFNKSLDSVTLMQAFECMVPELYRIVAPNALSVQDAEQIQQALVERLVESGALTPCIRI